MSSLADIAESAMIASAGQGQIFDLKVNYISPSEPGEELRATATVVHAGRRTVVTECRIEGLEGRLVATASGTFAITRDKE